ncbi:hypothetical protein [Clostridium ljungdahlii]|uniref:Uncharacterized protein n=1 Tax=Clostridium ljungdahlii TaxID=1538 RepID=A0A166REJ3_9CLOT|nr:hypothetical protein [Clostridium ljungdahlii]OAA90738.1 hypothetical protein WY13_01042 [Clostridium ljungdahlii]
MKTKQKMLKRKMEEKMDDLNELRSLGKSGLKIRREELKIVNKEIYILGEKLSRL